MIMEITRKMYLLAKELVSEYEDKKKIMTSIDSSMFKRRRLDLHLSMRNVAKITEVSVATISRVEKGNEAFYKTIVELDFIYSKLEEQKKQDC